MRLSIIIPVYNAERWLRELVESLNWQTCHDFEVIFEEESRASCHEHCPRHGNVAKSGQ